MPTTHYETLGIEKNASEKEIKQAYRALCMKFHPDRIQNASPEEQEEAKKKMQEINSANDILSDPQQRQMYDMELNGQAQGFPHGFPPGFGFPFGPGGPFGQGGVHFNPFGQGMHFNMQGGGPQDIFEALFGGGGGGPNIIFQRRIQKPEPIEKDIHISLKQAFEGMSYEFEVDRIIQHEHGGQTREVERITIQIPQGVDTGEAIIIQNRGHNVMSVCGDIRLNIHVTNDSEIVRNGIDLYYKKTITLKEALCGFKFKLDHINGNQISLNVNAIIYTGAKQVIKNFGMIKDGKVGDFVMEFNVTFPETLTQEQKDKLSEIL